jgi:hypothetical protein
MPVIETVCRKCGNAFEPDRRAIVGGVWRLCPSCRDDDPDHAPVLTTACQRCGRLLRGGRSLCLGCLGGVA